VTACCRYRFAPVAYPGVEIAPSSRISSVVLLSLFTDAVHLLPFLYACRDNLDTGSIYFVPLKIDHILQVRKG
jgi:hypothetical protein